MKYEGPAIAAISAGAAFAPSEWHLLTEDMGRLLATDKLLVGRDYSFSFVNVVGSWRGTRSRMQILPAPPGTPTIPQTHGDHPFVLEFAMYSSGIDIIDGYRRIKEHRRLTLMLNVLLRGRTSFQSNRIQQLWGTVLNQWPAARAEWVQASFFAPLGALFLPTMSNASAVAIAVTPAVQYYRSTGSDGPLVLPDNVDDNLFRYRSLPSPTRVRLDRSLYWLDVARRLWDVSSSASFAALVSAIESLTERGSIHKLRCDACDDDISHDSPGPTKQFREFLEEHAPGQSHKKQRNEMYCLRSAILHGDTLMQADQQTAFGWDPPTNAERSMHSDLWGLVRFAIRNWLLSRPTPVPT